MQVTKRGDEEQKYLDPIYARLSNLGHSAVFNGDDVLFLKGKGGNYFSTVLECKQR